VLLLNYWIVKSQYIFIPNGYTEKETIIYHENTKVRNHEKTMKIFVLFRFRVFVIAFILFTIN
jgi:hypothetical protein